MGFTIYTVVDALQGAPHVTRGLIALFTALNDPAFEGDRDAAADEARGAIRRALVQVTAINDDRVLRLYHDLIEAMLRTNAFAPAADEAAPAGSAREDHGLAVLLDQALEPRHDLVAPPEEGP